jgi:hypothetical protein
MKQPSGNLHALTGSARPSTPWAHPWVLRLGSPPAEPVSRSQWAEAVTTVAAYQDGWGVTTDDGPLRLQSVVSSTERARRRRLSQAGVGRAVRLSRKRGAHRLDRRLSRDHPLKNEELEI